MSVPGLVRVPAPTDLQEALAPVRAAGGRIAFVPTMGALHEGHMRLVDDAADVADAVVVSVFVNPLQFDDATDLAAYPREVDADAGLLAARDIGVPLLLYTPTVATMYPDHPAPLATVVHVRGLTAGLCGPHRPGHFDGVATAVAKLVAQVRPDVVVLGRKDFQQLQVVRRMVIDLDLGVEVLGVLTVREPGGLARSSRNRRLDGAARALAQRVPAALAAAVSHARSELGRGREERASDPAALVRTARAVLEVDGIDVQYVEAVDPDSLSARDVRPGAPVLVAVAVHVGEGATRVRLIDNVLVGDVEDEEALLAAIAADPDGHDD